MSSNPAAGDSLSPIPDDVISESEARMRRGKSQRDATKEKIKNKDYRSLDTPTRRRARAARMMGDPVAAPEAARVTGPALESMGAGDDVPGALLERIINGENFLGVRFLALGQRAARAIARIDIRTPDGRSGSGTGSLVTSRLLLTNNHVLQSSDWARRSNAVFDFEDDLDNKPRPTVAFELDPEAFFFTNKNFDFTLVAVKTTALHTGVSLDNYGFNPLDDTLGKITIGEPINIIQHPSGLLKQVVLQENRLLDIPEDPPGWLHYESDTMPGSSGAPLFNNRWEMVGLHHSGWPKRDEQGRILTVNDELWSREMGELAIKWLGNEGARVSQILQIVKAEQAAMDAGRQALVKELFNPPRTGSVVVPPGGNTPIVVSGSESVSLSRERKTEVVSQSAGSTGITLTLPLHITVSLGGSAATSAPVTTSTDRAATEPDETISREEVPDTDQAESLRELAEASTKPYYDAAADQVKRTDYYRDINLNANPDVLYNSLSTLLVSTHHTKLSYKPSRHLYPWVDLQPDRKLRSLYTGDIYEPKQLIEESFMAEAQFEALLESALLSDKAEESLSLLEAGLLYNCEHTVPRFWFKGGPLFSTAEGDLHHLFTCDEKCNNFRQNVAFFDFVDFGESVLQGCGRKEQDKFEPKEGKGAVSRAVMYFLLRYPRLIDDKPAELQAARLETILQWHGSEPVSDYERHRNAAIQEKQGNRNPLIDFPDLATRINFKLGLGNA
jgi:endonuclease G